MTDTQPTDDANLREAARRTAAAHTAASRDIEALVRRIREVPEPGDIAEYATLIAREQALRAERDGALGAVGLDAPSVEP
jgi:hypothetical protein